MSLLSDNKGQCIQNKITWKSAWKCRWPTTNNQNDIYFVIVKIYNLVSNLKGEVSWLQVPSAKDFWWLYFDELIIWDWHHFFLATFRMCWPIQQLERSKETRDWFWIQIILDKSLLTNVELVTGWKSHMCEKFRETCTVLLRTSTKH